MNYYIKEYEWEQIYQILSSRTDIRVKNKSKLRKFIEAIWYMARSGCQWRLLPSYYGSWRAVHARFKAWSDKGVWHYLFLQSQICPDLEAVMIDATIVRAHPCSAGYYKDSNDQEGLGRSKGGFTSKIHALVDALGNPLKFIITAGQRNDITQGENLIKDQSHSIVIADKGYDANKLVEALESKACEIVIPPKKNRKFLREYDEHIYKERHLIECFFGKIKHFRRVFSRFDKSTKVFLDFLHFVGTFIWLR